MCNVFDEAAGLSSQVSSLEDTFSYTMLDGTPIRFQCLLTGGHFYFVYYILFGWLQLKCDNGNETDGKAMKVSNHLPGYECWVCTLDTSDPAALAQQHSVPNDCASFLL